MEGVGGFRTGPEVVIPPPPLLKKGRGPSTPPLGSGSHTPTQGYLGGTPLPFSGWSVTSERQPGESARSGVYPPPPTGSSPRWGPPATFFVPGIPPPPQVKKGRGPSTPPLGSGSYTPTQGYLGGTPLPFSGWTFTSETCLHPAPSGVFGWGVHLLSRASVTCPPPALSGRGVHLWWGERGVCLYRLGRGMVFLHEWGEGNHR